MTVRVKERFYDYLGDIEKNTTGRIWIGRCVLRHNAGRVISYCNGMLDEKDCGGVKPAVLQVLIGTFPSIGIHTAMAQMMDRVHTWNGIDAFCLQNI